MAETDTNGKEALRGDGIMVASGEAGLKLGIVFVEARIKDGLEFEVDKAKLRVDLEGELSLPNRSFDLWEDLLADPYQASLTLGGFHPYSKEVLHSLKVVEYAGPKTDITCYSTNNVTVKVHVYQLYHTPRSLEENETFPQAEITPMPHIRFDGRWDELVFNEDLKGDLIWVMTNMVRFSQNPEEPGEMNRLILLHGPPGTGKTTLCQGLAQKISIRLNLRYTRTKLIQIRTATLLSKYYSESAKQVDEIFTAIERMCDDDPDEFFCVLIDEVESIANSRESSAKHGEAQDSLRATNAFLTGIDRAKSHTNVIFLCTSNMLESLDAAFIDRCGIKLEVDLPMQSCQYSILRGRIQKLIYRGAIHSEKLISPYRDACIDADVDSALPSSRLLQIVKLINSANARMPSGGRTSGRSLMQLPEQALLRHLREEECDLDMALKFIEELVRSEINKDRKVRARKRKRDLDGGCYGYMGSDSEAYLS